MSCGHEATHEDHNHSHAHEPDDTEGQSLFQFIDTTGVRCLNENEPNMCTNCLKPWTNRLDTEPVLQSQEDDAELIIFVPFTTVVKIKSISLIGGPEGASPIKLKLFINRDDIDFSIAEELTAVQSLDIIEEVPPGSVPDYPVKPHKFRGVHSITIYVPDNHGADSTIISYLGFKGEGTGIVREAPTEVVYESKPQLSDHQAPADLKGASYMQ